MLKSLRLAICLIAAPAVLASGCGSTKTTTTHTTATAPAATSASATGSTSPTGSTSGKGSKPATASTPASKSPQAGKSPRPKLTVPSSIPGTTPKQEHHFNEARAVQRQLAEGHLSKQAAKAKREHIERELENETFGKIGTERIRHRVPSRLQFATEIQRSFMTGCTSTKKSISSCECILAKFEERKGKKGLRIAEMLYTEARMRLHESLPRRIRRIVAECANAHA
jgi:hypothetical protein